MFNRLIITISLVPTLFLFCQSTTKELSPDILQSADFIYSLKSTSDIIANTKNIGYSGGPLEGITTRQLSNAPFLYKNCAPGIVLLVAIDASSMGSGSIINISSVSGMTGGEIGISAYSASKAGVIGVTKQLAIEWASLGIRINAVAPSWFPSYMTRHFTGEDSPFRELLLADCPFGRFGKPCGRLPGGNPGAHFHFHSHAYQYANQNQHTDSHPNLDFNSNQNLDPNRHGQSALGFIPG